jgi:hypothetical protein
VRGFRVESGGVGFRLIGVGPKSAAIAGFAPGARLEAALSDARGRRTATLTASARGDVIVEAGDAPEVEVRIA